jgi:hypothetical protein
MGRLVKLRDAVQVIPASAPRPLGLKPAFLGMSVCRPPSGVILSRRGSAPFCHPPAGTQPDPINLLDQAGLSPRPDHPPIRHADAKGEIAALAFAVEALALLRQRRDTRYAAPWAGQIKHDVPTSAPERLAPGFRSHRAL